MKIFISIMESTQFYNLKFGVWGEILPFYNRPHSWPILLRSLGSHTRSIFKDNSKAFSKLAEVNQKDFSLLKIENIEKPKNMNTLQRIAEYAEFIKIYVNLTPLWSEGYSSNLGRAIKDICNRIQDNKHLKLKLDGVNFISIFTSFEHEVEIFETIKKIDHVYQNLTRINNIKDLTIEGNQSEFNELIESFKTQFRNTPYFTSVSLKGITICTDSVESLIYSDKYHSDLKLSDTEFYFKNGNFLIKSDINSFDFLKENPSSLIDQIYGVYYALSDGEAIQDIFMFLINSTLVFTNLQYINLFDQKSHETHHIFMNLMEMYKGKAIVNYICNSKSEPTVIVNNTIMFLRTEDSKIIAVRADSVVVGMNFRK